METSCYKYYVRKLCYGLGKERQVCSFLTHCLSLFLWIGVTLAFFHSDLKIISRGLQVDIWNNISMGIMIILSSWASFESSLVITFVISFMEKSSSNSDLSVMKGKSEDNVLPLSINERCLAKEELKILLFSLKSVINLFSRKSGRFFLPFKNFFNRVQ